MTAPDWIFPDNYDDDQLRLYVGFIYRVTNLATGRFYIGKKNLMAKRGKKMVPSNWRKYWGSSDDLQMDLKTLGHDKFKREIVAFCLTKGALTYEEIAEQIRCDVLGAKLADGSPASYNRSVHGRWFAGITDKVIRC